MTLVYAGLEEKLWRQLLHHEMLYIRLCALRVLSRMGEAGARALLSGPSFRRPDEGYPFVWALSRCVDAQFLEKKEAANNDLLLRARFCLRRASRRPDWKYRMNRSACAQALVNSEHPLESMACAVRLLEMHGLDAIPPLLEVLRERPRDGSPLGTSELLEETAECAVWALGQLGRAAVPEIVQELRGASPRVARHLAMALWYLGRKAAPAAVHLVKDSSEQATAALLAMKEGASLQMVQSRRGPVWLDESSVQALAEIAFSDGDRHYAAAALGCFGPASASTLPILRYLAEDPSTEVRLNVATGLSWGGRAEAVSVLLLLCDDPEESVATRARKAVRDYGGDPADVRASLWVLLLQGGVSDRRRAAQRLVELGFPPGAEPNMGRLLEDEDEVVVGHMLSMLIRHQTHSEFLLEKLLGLLSIGKTHRALAARVLRAFGDHPQTRPVWRQLIWDENPSVAFIAAEGVAQSVLSLKEWGLGAVELVRLPSPILARLLEKRNTSLLKPEELLPLLKRPEAGARLAAALALGYCADRSARVVKVLATHLIDPSDAVAVACARCLVNLGEDKYSWALLRSPRAHEQELALRTIRQDGLPRKLRDYYVSGRFYNAATLGVLKEKLTLEKVVDTVVEATLQLAPAGRALAAPLVELGPAVLPRMPELLGSSSFNVRQRALEAFEELLQAPSAAVTEWLIRSLLILPLEAGEDADGERERFCNRLQRAVLPVTAKVDELGFAPLWLIMSRSGLAETALQGLNFLAQGYTRFTDESLREGILNGLLHFEPSVRRYALRIIASSLTPELWRPRGNSLEARLLLVARLFGEGEVEPAILQSGVELLSKFQLEETPLLVPTRPAQLIALLRLAGCSERYNTGLKQLIWGYRGKTDKLVWAEVWRLSMAALSAEFHSELVMRWPRLVIVALMKREDASEWIASLHQRIAPALRQALKHRQLSVRRRVLQLLAREPRGWRLYFLWELQEMARTDPSPELRQVAAGLLP